MSQNSANLDVLRAYAVFAVAASHTLASIFPSPALRPYLHNLGGGGVLFFFVHTTLVLMLSMERTGDESGWHISFYIRRAFRIFPLCWVAIILALVTRLADYPFETFGWKGVLANVLLVQNVTRHANVIGPLWSLPWEVQMYLVLPLLYVLARDRPTPRLSIGMWILATAVAIGGTAPMAPRLFHAAVIPPMFLGGFVAFQLSKITRPRLPAWLWPLAIPAAMMARTLLLDGDSIETSYNAAINAMTCLVVGLAVPHFHEVRSPWLVRSGQTIAKYSYGIYLFHAPMILLFLGRLRMIPQAISIFLAVGATGAISYLLFHAVEQPAITLGKRVARGVATVGPTLSAGE